MNPSVSPLKILVFEQNPDLGKLMRFVLSDLGFTVHLLAQASDAAAHPDASLCFVTLYSEASGAGFDDFEVLRQFCSQADLVVMAPSTHRYLMYEALRRGASDTLEKPFSVPKDLLPVINRAVRTITLRQNNEVLTSQISQKSKLMALGEIAAVVIHDIASPVSTILLSLEDLETDSKKEDEALESFSEKMSPDLKLYAKAVRQACDKILGLTERLRMFSRQETFESRAQVSVRDLIVDSLFFVQAKIRKFKVKVQINMDESLKDFKFVCQKNKISQVLINLISNACDAMNGVSDPKLDIKVNVGPDLLEICVTDTGSGMDATVLAKLFQPFFTTKPPELGTGLGMNIIRKNVEEHGGSIDVESEVGVGTTFVLKFPLKTKAQTLKINQ